MRDLTRWAPVLLLVVGACGGSNLGGRGGSGGFGTGGVTGIGGFGGDGTGGGAWGGTTGAGGIIADGGSTGAGGDIVGWGGGTTGAGGLGGTGGTTGLGGPPFPDGGTCSAPTPGPLSTWDTPRPFGWTFTGTPAAAAPDAGSADAGANPAVCRTVPAAFPGVSCVGLASLQSTAKGPAIIFSDGSQLAWDGTLAAALAPYVQNVDAGGDGVWVDYEEWNVVICPFCGAYTNHKLQIRSGAGGAIRFYDQAGDLLPNLTDAQVLELFGVSATAIQTCTFPAQAGCSTYLRSEFDHQLQTTPPQTVVDATLTKVKTPNASFQVFWASSIESYIEQPVPTCADGPSVASDTGFVAALLAP